MYQKKIVTLQSNLCESIFCDGIIQTSTFLLRGVVFT